MLALRKMQPREYPAYHQYFIADYSSEIVENYGQDLDAAIAMAKRDLQESFPNGLIDTKHELLCIESEIMGELTLIGYLWHCKNTADRSTFIYDFYIAEPHRGKGYGHEAISLFEARLSLEKITQIKLRVAYHNKRALKLYQQTGFVITGINMAKKVASG